MSGASEVNDATYAAACSDLTLCSNSKGFLRSMLDSYMELVEDWLETFEAVEDGKKVAAVLANTTLMDGFAEFLDRIQPMYRGKDALASQERRKAAQEALAVSDFKLALGFANQAVLKAPKTNPDEILGRSLVLALWERSGLLLKLNRPLAALEDLKQAYKAHLPAQMKVQFFLRIAECYTTIDDSLRANMSYLLGMQIRKGEPVAEKILKSWEECVFTTTGPENKGEAEQNVPVMSKLVKITEQENKGRFAVADSPIKTGDVILKEAPYAACLLSDYYGTRCLHCFNRLEDCVEAPSACPTCSGVIFCCVRCRNQAISTYHLYECQFLNLFIGSGMSILSHIALRMVTQAGLEKSLSLHSKFVANDEKITSTTALSDIESLSKIMEEKLVTEAYNTKGNFNEDTEVKDAQIYSLCTNSDKRKSRDYIKRILMGLFLTECLKKAGFFKNNDTTKSHNAITELLVRNMLLLQFNAHEIYETLRGEHQFSGSRPVFIAVGIYPNGALFNHECYPAVARYFKGKKIVLRAVRPLKPGDVVSENYGPHFMTKGLKERQRSLAARYWFRCECVPCKEDWPTLKAMNCDAPPYLRCPNMQCDGKFKAISNPPTNCAKCDTDIDPEFVKAGLEIVKQSVIKYQAGARFMDEENIDGATKSMCEGIDHYYEVARGPHRETHIAQESLRSCFAARGNCHIVGVTKKQNS